MELGMLATDARKSQLGWLADRTGLGLVDLVKELECLCVPCVAMCHGTNGAEPDGTAQRLTARVESGLVPGTTTVFETGPTIIMKVRAGSISGATGGTTPCATG